MTPFQLHVRKWRNCRRCELACQRSNIVLCRGKLPADVLLIGEAPGQSEDAHGVPFAPGAPAGKLLESLIRRAGWNDLTAPARFIGDPASRPTVRWAATNLVACFPREAKKTEDHKPPEAAIKACRDRLAEIVKLAAPQAVVCVGDLAGNWVQKFRAGLGLGDVKVIEIVHPAYILRQNEAQQEQLKRRAVVKLATVAAELVPF